MRNILVFPDGSEHDFMYPTNREVEIGTSLQVKRQDDSVEILQIKTVQKTDKEIYYHLGF